MLRQSLQEEAIFNPWSLLRAPLTEAQMELVQLCALGKHTVSFKGKRANFTEVDRDAQYGLCFLYIITDRSAARVGAFIEGFRKKGILHDMEDMMGRIQISYTGIFWISVSCELS